MSALLFALFFGRFAHVASDGSPYLAYALAGTAAWTFCSSSAASAMESLVSDQVLLRKIYFPREILPLAAAAAALVGLLPAVGIALVVAAAYGIYPSPECLLLPVPLVLLQLTVAALGLGVSALNVYYRDIRYALPFLLQLGLFASPVAYPLS